MIGIARLKSLVAALRQVDLATTQQRALREVAEDIAETVRESLSHGPGPEHAFPWLQSGRLRDSIETDVAGEEAIIGSADRTAVFQEHGTSIVPPRPFLAPAGAASADGAARTVGGAIADAVREALR